MDRENTCEQNIKNILKTERKGSKRNNNMVVIVLNKFQGVRPGGKIIETNASWKGRKLNQDFYNILTILLSKLFIFWALETAY